MLEIGLLVGGCEGRVREPSSPTTEFQEPAMANQKPTLVVSQTRIPASMATNAALQTSIAIDRATASATANEFLFFGGNVVVARVVDGERIRVELGERIVTVRLLDVDATIPLSSNGLGQCYGKEAQEFVTEMIERADGIVWLESDQNASSSGSVLWRYVWLEHPDGRRLLNEELIKWGFARTRKTNQPGKYHMRFQKLQQTAEQKRRGLWGACNHFGEVLPTPISEMDAQRTEAAVAQTMESAELEATLDAYSTTRPTLTPIPPRQSDCDFAYPTVCIPPVWLVGDLDCGDIPHLARFLVLDPDPHNFDTDHDGIGCEWN